MHYDLSMEIAFSRHARRRARLYDISESSVSAILAGVDLPVGEHAIILKNKSISPQSITFLPEKDFRISTQAPAPLIIYSGK
jgi:hypothetical protein